MDSGEPARFHQKDRPMSEDLNPYRSPCLPPSRPRISWWHSLAHRLHVNRCTFAEHQIIGGHMYIVVRCATCDEPYVLAAHSLTCECNCHLIAVPTIE